ncbi:amino acid adenylation domain-containing protein [Campylobacter hepaticus]|uniref:Amino acid adenylation domain-containing protein n=1 Tax=Campylobacter hepaticus TaxID=1813019 RepID=A0A6A7JQT7_9BACT|nr:amino acid adenylation domain-containing protein [Campylobacter hepaticus]AXP08242.1 amino acid adenylation domain-containing protein [Campylobacter hepaticus]MCZ0772063.1 amino acid adenylation domain-containing protein [Campylobacter hepaticus]MCZ0773532.1 amino acid adenylation domain-containing protein [Campylobacter hepaticus]MCZ0774782.1 amino acid adenylation domain-containing protein [Campylobacter hepaticus]MDX2330791.1 amino acid adenylation domain-containing protein [Campylobacte
MITHIYDFLENNVNKYANKNLFVEFNQKSITYENFHLMSKKLASKILKDFHDNTIQIPILIILPKSIDCLIAFFGVALSGNFYTLLDEKTPKERIKKVIEILKPKLLITAKELELNLNLPTLYTQDFENFNIDETLIQKARKKHIDTNLLYVLFTSGSTGIPKGVSISHKSVIDYTFWVCETFNFDENEILANQAPFYFDNSVLDIFSSVKAGATLHILPNALFAFPNKIIHYLIKHEVNTIFWVPSVLIYFANTNTLKTDNIKLKKILFCGEIMPNKQLNLWRKHLPHALFANLYGPTEITDVCSYYIIDRQFNDDELLPIGKACKNTELLVFDEDYKLINQDQVGIKGELYVRGTSLSLGYYNDKEKSKKAFIQNPLHDNYLDLLYKTGDIVAYNALGELLCYGRKDNQIKYMGHRIELGEIESIINSHPEIKNSACIFKDDIICFYESENEINCKAFLNDKLPSYMIPKKFIKIDHFKLNQNGKIDRKVLGGEI